MGACPAHRGQSWSPRPRSRATVHSEGRAGRHEGKTARLVSQRTRRPRPAHQLSLHAARCLAERIASPSPKVVGRDTPKDAPARSNTLRSRRYRSQAARIYVEGRPYLAGRRGQRMRLACLDVRKRPPGYARDLRELPLGHPLLFAQAPHLLAVHHQIHHSFSLLGSSLWQPSQTNVCGRVSLALVAPSLVVAAWLIGAGLSAIRATAAPIGGFPLFTVLVHVADEHPGV